MGAMKPWLMYAVVPAVVMVAQAEESAEAPAFANKLQQVVDRLISDKVIAPSAQEENSLGRSISRFSLDRVYTDEIHQHLAACLAGEEDINAYEWLPSVCHEYYMKNTPMPVELVQLLIEAGADVNASTNQLPCALLWACAGGSIEAAKALIAAGADVNYATGDGDSVLSVAVDDGNIELTKLLLAAGADPKKVAEGRRDESLLALAVRSGEPELCRILISAGLDPTQADRKGRTPLGIALGYDDKPGDHLFLVYFPPCGEVARVLMEAGAQVDAERCSPLRLACALGDVAEVKKLLAAGANASEKFSSGATPLLLAIRANQPDMVADLLAAGVDPNALCMENVTPLAIACMMGCERIADILLAAGANINAKPSADSLSPLLCSLIYANARKIGVKKLLRFYGKTEPIPFIKKLLAAGADPNLDNGFFSALSLVIQLNDLELLDAFLAAGGNPTVCGMNDVPIFFQAVDDEKMEMLKKLLATGIDMYFANHPEHISSLFEVVSMRSAYKACALLLEEGLNVDQRDAKDGQTPLMTAARHGDIELCRLLIAAGADINATDSGSDTPLSIASRAGEDAIVSLLIDSGVDLNDESERGLELFNSAVSRSKPEFCAKLVAAGLNIKRWRPLHLAAVLGNVDEVKKLLDSGVKVDMLFRRRTALMYAAHMGHTEVCRVLIEAGAKVNYVDKNGWSPLLAAANGGRMDTFRFLCESGADLRSDELKGIFSRSVSNSNADIVPLLLSAGASATAKEEDCFWDATPLHIALKRNLPLSAIKALVQAGADVKAVDDDGNTPLHFAVRNGSASLNSPICAFLISAGADPDAKNSEGETPRDLAEKRDCIIFSMSDSPDSF